MFGDPSTCEGIAFKTVQRIGNMLRRDVSNNFLLKQSLSVEFSFLEIYNENIFDLLDGQRPLPCTRESVGGAVPQGTTKLQCSIQNIEAKMISWLKKGAASR